MTGSLLNSRAESMSPLWRDYWKSVWHKPIAWHPERIKCFLDPATGRTDLGKTGRDALVSDYPRGQRPFLGVVAHSPDGSPSPESGVLELNDDGHLLTVAPTRSGKGAAHIVPNLLLYAGSCLVIDIKGENYDVTAAHRARMFDGAKVVRFAPFEAETDTYNPLDFVRVGEFGAPTTDTFDDARLLAEMLIPSSAKDDFWDIEARNLLTMLLYYVAVRYPPGDGARNMATVVGLLFRPEETGPAGESIPGLQITLDDIRAEAVDMDIPVLRALHAAFLDHERKVRSNITSTCRSKTQIWLSPNLQRATASSSFQFSDLKRSMCRPVEDNPAPTTIYVIMPPEYLGEYRPVLRVMAGLAAVELTRPAAWADQPDYRAAPPCPVLLILDEFPSLGPIRPIANGLAYLAGYGVQVWTFVQNIGQLKELYQENWTTFIANAAVTAYFGVTDPELAESLSRQLGDTSEYQITHTTTAVTSGNSESSTSGRSLGESSGGTWSNWSSSSNSGMSDSSTSGTSSSVTQTENVRFKKDPVATASDIRSLSPEVQLIFMRNKRPILASLLLYWKCGLFGNLYGQWGR